MVFFQHNFLYFSLFNFVPLRINLKKMTLKIIIYIIAVTIKSPVASAPHYATTKPLRSITTPQATLNYYNCSFIYLQLHFCYISNFVVTERTFFRIFIIFAKISNGVFAKF